MRGRRRFFSRVTFLRNIRGLKVFQRPISNSAATRERMFLLLAAALPPSPPSPDSTPSTPRSTFRARAAARAHKQGSEAPALAVQGYVRPREQEVSIAKEAQKWYDEMCPDDKQNQKNSGWEKIRVTMHIRDTLDEKWKASGGPTGAIIKADLADLAIHDPDHGPAQLMYHLILGTEWSISFLLYQEWCPLHDTVRFYNGLSAPLTAAKIAPYITNEEYLVLVAFLHLMSASWALRRSRTSRRCVLRLGQGLALRLLARVESSVSPSSCTP